MQISFFLYAKTFGLQNFGGLFYYAKIKEVANIPDGIWVDGKLLRAPAF